MDWAANAYRIAAENICKAVLFEHGKIEPHPTLEKLGVDAAKALESTEPQRDIAQFKADLKYIQNIGNVFSHDGAGSANTNDQDQDSLFRSLAQILRIVFYGGNELVGPKLPGQMRRYFSSRQVYRNDIADLSIAEVAQICYPKNEVSKSILKKDRADRLNYEYTSIDLGGNLSKGLLFIRQGSSIERTLLDTLTTPGFKKPSALEIVTPRVYRPDGKQINRIKSIQDKIRDIRGQFENWNVHVKYFDDFAWEYSLPASFKNSNLAPRLRDYFIQQKIQPAQHTKAAQTSNSPVSAIEYIDAVLYNPQEYSAVHVMVGQAGIGKTTLCDSIAQHIQAKHRRKALLISATDFRGVTVNRQISSVQDLYAVASENDLIDEAISIENKNFEINLACGNLVLIIDGFDELESNLGDFLNSTEFIASLGTLDGLLQNVLVIMTVRDHNLNRFLREEHVSVCQLLGFSDSDAEKYLASRLSNVQLPEAKRMLKTFELNGELSGRKTVPLYASLICDHLSAPSHDQASTDSIAHSTGRFLWAGSPLDTLLSKIIARELTKQSLSSLSGDDYFEILIEVVRSPQATILLTALDACIQSCNASPTTIPIQNFLRNPFLVSTTETARFKYDSLLDHFKSRYICRRLLDGIFSMSPTAEFLAEACYGAGPLFEELVHLIPPADFLSNGNTTKWLAAFRANANSKDPQLGMQWKRAMSSLLYWCVAATTDKAERTEILTTFFGGDMWIGFTIFGRFYNLDLSCISIIDGYLENFTSIKTSTHQLSVPTYHSTKVVFDDEFLPDKLEEHIFAPDCEWSENLDSAFQAKRQSEETGLEVQIDNLYRILKVGFRGNAFLWKSETLYRKATVHGKFTLQGYLDLLCTRGVIRREPSKPGPEFGYSVSPDWQEDARKLIEDRNTTVRIKNLLLSIPTGR